ncbi:homoserine dehydrogenase [Dyella sp.]|uniref:homoserine dehydrogenase n=1 Tax=Dyella sp. TaxID=1869338 RepID=UPI0039C88802
MNVCISPAAKEPLSPPHAIALPATTARRRTLAVGLIGPGRVGSALLDQIRTAQPRLTGAGLDLQLRGIVSRQRMWLDSDDPELNARRDCAQTWRPADLSVFADYVRGDDGRHAMLIDCSASELVADHYAEWLAAGLHVVTPNKLASSGSLDRWTSIRNASLSGARFRYEATVCAGLPVVQTLRDLLDTGDRLLAIDGMFSGTLAWLCNRYDGSRPFCEFLREACELGYTEPDPRDDLSGRDVARKLVILAREAGWHLSLDDVDVQSLVPPALADVSLEDFMQHMHALNPPMAARLAEARARGAVLRHVASLNAETGKASVSLGLLPASHPFAHSRLTDNVVQFTTRRYHDNPMIVQGPGAGPEVTAAGIFADVLRIADALSQEFRP